MVSCPMISGGKVGFCGLSDIENQLLLIGQQIMQATQPLYRLQVNLMVNTQSCLGTGLSGLMMNLKY
jgi:hypothetical protein